MALPAHCLGAHEGQTSVTSFILLNINITLLSHAIIRSCQTQPYRLSIHLQFLLHSMEERQQRKRRIRSLRARSWRAKGRSSLHPHHEVRETSSKVLRSLTVRQLEAEAPITAQSRSDSQHSCLDIVDAARKWLVCEATAIVWKHAWADQIQRLGTSMLTLEASLKGARCVRPPGGRDAKSIGRH